MAPTHSKGLEVEVYLLACGHGDTILIRFPGDKWILVDCYLPKRDGTRKRFFDFVEKRGIDRLEMVILTHPDYDHFLGMAEVLDYFSRNGRSLGVFCDSGVDPQQMQILLNRGPGSREYKKLHEKVDELDAADKVGYYAVCDEHEPIVDSGAHIKLFPVAPDSARLRRENRSAIRRLAHNSSTELEANARSIILVLSLRDGEEACNILLAADAGKSEIESALAAWRKRAAKHQLCTIIDALKVPHHGSLKSHCDELCAGPAREDSDRIAAISAGMRSRLPDSKVIGDYMSKGWKVLITTKRSAKRRSNSPHELVNRRQNVESGPKTQDRKLLWRGGKGLTWSPITAQITASELDQYESAFSTT